MSHKSNHLCHWWWADHNHNNKDIINYFPGNSILFSMYFNISFWKRFIYLCLCQTLLRYFWMTTLFPSHGMMKATLSTEEWCLNRAMFLNITATTSELVHTSAKWSESWWMHYKSPKKRDCRWSIIYAKEHQHLAIQTITAWGSIRTLRHAKKGVEAVDSLNSILRTVTFPIKKTEYYWNGDHKLLKNYKPLRHTPCLFSHPLRFSSAEGFQSNWSNLQL